MLCALLALGQPAAAEPLVPYVALGDSYSSGEGNGPFDGRCHRAQRIDSAYPRMLPSLVGYLSTPIFRACTGATIADVVQRPQPKRGDQLAQLEYVTPSAGLVTLTIGGNDLGFKSIVVHCLLPGSCSGGGFARRIEAGLETIGARLAAAYVAVRERMDPDGQLVVAGYPRLFVDDERADCKHFISESDAKWINSMALKGDRRIAEAVRAARRQAGNVSYVDVSERFAGHELCSEHPWLYGIKPALEGGLIKGSYHPRKEGQEAYAKAFATLLRTPAMRAALTG